MFKNVFLNIYMNSPRIQRPITRYPVWVFLPDEAKAPYASGNKWRKTSPRRPPTAKLKSSLSFRDPCSERRFGPASWWYAAWFWWYWQKWKGAHDCYPCPSELGPKYDFAEAFEASWFAEAIGSTREESEVPKAGLGFVDWGDQLALPFEFVAQACGAVEPKAECC